MSTRAKPKAKSLKPRAQSLKPGAPAVGVIGLGIMGSAMSRNLMRARHAVVGFDVLEKRRQELRRAGGQVAADNDEIAARAQIMVTSLPSASALQDVVAEIASAPRRRGTLIETSTLPIAVKEDARERLRAAGITMLDCPISGTGVQAVTRDIVVYASGDRAAYRRVSHVLDGFCRAHYYVGAFGAGSRMKFVANLLVAIHNVAAAEAMVLGMKAGLDPALVLKVIADGAGASRMLQVRGPMMVNGDYSKASMKLEVWQKDMTVIADFAREIGAATPLFATTAPIYNAAIAMDRREEDTAAVCAVLEQMAGMRRGPQARGVKSPMDRL